ncbi:uncharacterized protein N7498_008924, partial [Penicillium cinerascens]
LNVISSALMFFRGRLGLREEEAIEAKMLLNYGASHSFMSHNGRVRWHELDSRRNRLVVELPNGEKIRTRRYYRVPELDLKEYDIILGYDFLRKFNPTLDWPFVTRAYGRWGDRYTKTPRGSLTRSPRNKPYGH